MRRNTWTTNQNARPMLKNAIYQTFTPGLHTPEKLCADPLMFVFFQDKLLAATGDGTFRIPGQPALREILPENVVLFYLGKLQSRDCLAAGVDEALQPPENHAWISLRRAFMGLEEHLRAIAGRAFQIVDWDRTHRFCGRCGATNKPATQVRAKKCPQCGLMSFPRLSPAMIIRVTKGNEILLARSPHFPDGMYSVLAGFVDAGENLEEAVERELLEEVNIRVKNLRYFGSQAWPFPDSLMIAFTADYASGELRIDRKEIEDACWFSSHDLPQIPPKISIARRLIDDFLQQPNMQAQNR